MNLHRRIVNILSVFGVLLLMNQTMAEAKRLQLPDLGRIVRLSDPQLSPNGKKVALIISKANFEDNHYDNQLLLVDVRNGEQKLITHHRYGVRHPRWSPDGMFLAFLAADKDKKLQIFTLSLEGGEALQVTQATTSVSAFSWRPDGQAIAFVRKDDPVKKKGIERHNKSFEVGNSSYLDTSEALPFHFWLASLSTGEVKRLTQGQDSVSGGVTSRAGLFSWSPDGEEIAYVSQPLPHSGEYINSGIKLLTVHDGSLRTFIHSSPLYPSHIEYSPNGQYLAYSHSVGPEPSFTPSGVYMKAVKGGDEIQLSSKIDRSISGTWLPDGKAILAYGNDRTTKTAWKISLDGKVKSLDWGDIEARGEISVSSKGSFAFIGADPQNPPELYYASSASSKPKPLTRFNGWVTSLETGKVDTISWKSHDGFDLNGVLIYPPNFDPSKKYPLVLHIHGGPMGTSTEAFSGVLGGLRRVMAAQDWLVFSPNYRGSSNMGLKFQRAIVNDAGDGPGRDVMAGIETIKAMGIVDDKKIAVSGWSYGGYMTAWLIGNYQGWAAAVAGAAVTDFIDQYNMMDLQKWEGYGFGGSPWLNDNAKSYWQQSPIAYAHQIRTPTLILSNIGDARVTVTQSYKLFHALQDNEVPVEFIAYPVSGHFPGDPVHVQDIQKRWVNWIKEKFENIQSGATH